MNAQRIKKIIKQLEDSLNDFARYNTHDDVFTCELYNMSTIKIVKNTNRNYGIFIDTFLYDYTTGEFLDDYDMAYLQHYLPIIRNYRNQLRKFIIPDYLR